MAIGVVFNFFTGEEETGWEFNRRGKKLWKWNIRLHLGKSTVKRWDRIANPVLRLNSFSWNTEEEISPKHLHICTENCFKETITLFIICVSSNVNISFRHALSHTCTNNGNAMIILSPFCICHLAHAFCFFSILSTAPYTRVN